MTTEDELPHLYESIKLGKSPSQKAPVPIPTGVASTTHKVPPALPYLRSTSGPAILQGTRPKYATLDQVALAPSSEYSTVGKGGERDSSHSEKVADSTPVTSSMKTQKLKRRNKWGKGLTVGNYASGIIALLALLVAIIALIVSATSLTRKCECPSAQESHSAQTEQQLDELRNQLNSTQRDIANLRYDGWTSVLNNTYCKTSIASTCTLVYSVLGTPPTYTLCETSPMRVERPGFYTKDIQCGITDLGGQINPIASTLLFDQKRQRAWCSCYGIVPSEDTVVDLTAEVVCSLIITRCAHEP